MQPELQTSESRVRRLLYCKDLTFLIDTERSTVIAADGLYKRDVFSKPRLSYYKQQTLTGSQDSQIRSLWQQSEASRHELLKSSRKP